jgi:F0F1-type ATP synthase assembly protein I
MFPEPSNRKEMGRLLALSQVGVEMVAPIVLGVYLDSRFGWAPWGLVAGAALGLIGGLGHLIYLSNRLNQPPGPGPSRRSEEPK